MNSGIITKLIKAINTLFNIRIELITYGRLVLSVPLQPEHEHTQQTLTKLIESNLHTNFFFIQVGANDGKSFDPIHDMVTKHKLKGICVEPIKEYFAKLSHTYQNYQHVKPINKAIAEKSGPISMYRVNTEHQDSLPDWSVGIASLDSKHHQKSNIDKHYMVEETVEAITFSTLLQEEEITDVDLVVIDTEGYDLKIIEMIRSSHIKPKIVFFEHQHFIGSENKDQLTACIAEFQKNGYLIYLGSCNTIAYLP